MTSREAIIALNMLPKLGPIKVRNLIHAIGSAEAIFSASRDTLEAIQGIGPSISHIICHWEDYVDLSQELQQARERRIRIITKEDACYPAPLRESYDPPLCLYVWGEVLAEDNHAIAMVGSRRTTHYGRDTAHQFGSQLAQLGYTVISGLARGIDTYSHEGALAGGGRTIAVIGSGLTKMYPPENMALAERIADGRGAVVSEFPLNKAPDKKTFPMRNRIVAAWSSGVLVVEAPTRSGSLITANIANDIGRPIYAVPGSIQQPLAAGCHQLIREGATLVTEASQIHHDLQETRSSGFVPFQPELTAQQVDTPKLSTPQPPSPKLPIEQDTILQSLQNEALLLDEVAEQTQLPIATVSASLLALELLGLITKLPGARYAQRGYSA